MPGPPPSPSSSSSSSSPHCRLRTPLSRSPLRDRCFGLNDVITLRSADESQSHGHKTEQVSNHRPTSQLTSQPCRPAIPPTQCGPSLLLYCIQYADHVVTHARCPRK
ncbi:uncharacterized protein K452DRAFT_163426 [Aplosporella prunicola CBS 121167]|uniref:Uncharacterized protein n=1 Tax=Aplosporella prunicola CBS 121167 TaxID=1176127 RepID=A0A6A6BJQ7_9PEZI|nr:uncharacterized protein K452DRAFT_163426 [Aplosporella prunicola CBS 121167]KAF2143858.1 hypothetical protein K452DRAFT_163426 [Aplosporella prunicola CBS 121167]